MSCIIKKDLDWKSKKQVRDVPSSVQSQNAQLIEDMKARVQELEQENMRVYQHTNNYVEKLKKKHEEDTLVFQQEIKRARDIIEKHVSVPLESEKIRKQIEVKELQINKLAAEIVVEKDLGGTETKKRISVAERGTASQPIRKPKKKAQPN
jgi:type IV secretory pathway VirB4 component